jgi:hypothetical protein
MRRLGKPRTKAVVLLGKGWTAVAVVEALLLDEGMERSYRRV